MTQTPDRPTGAVTPEEVRRPLTAYRVLAWATGLWLLALCYWMVQKYVFDDNSLRWIGQAHGAVYFAYLLATFNLAIKVRWPIGKTIGTLLAGTVPLLGLIVEHYRTAEVRERFGL